MLHEGGGPGFPHGFLSAGEANRFGDTETNPGASAPKTQFNNVFANHLFVHLVGHHWLIVSVVRGSSVLSSLKEPKQNEPDSAAVLPATPLAVCAGEHTLSNVGK